MQDTRAASRRLQQVLFPALQGPAGDEQALYAAIDGAAVPSLLGVLTELDPPRACLFAGKLAPDVARVAPYLVRLEAGTSFTSWLLERQFGTHAAILLRSRLDLDGLRKHLRRFTMVKLPDGKQAFFRFYDPRVLRVYLPTCNAEELDQFFGQAVEAFLCEGEDARQVLEFRRGAGGEPLTHDLEA